MSVVASLVNNITQQLMRVTIFSVQIVGLCMHMSRTHDIYLVYSAPCPKTPNTAKIYPIPSFPYVEMELDTSQVVGHLAISIDK